MSRKYVISGSLAAFTAGDIIEINAPANAIVKIASVQVSQSSSEADDSTEIRVSKFATAGTGGTVPTPEAVETGDAAFGGTLRQGAGVAAAGTERNSWAEGISSLAGFQKIWTPEYQPVLSPSERMVVKAVGALTAVTLIYTVEFEEIGG